MVDPRYLPTAPPGYVWVNNGKDKTSQYELGLQLGAKLEDIVVLNDVAPGCPCSLFLPEAMRSQVQAWHNNIYTMLNELKARYGEG